MVEDGWAESQELVAVASRQGLGGNTATVAVSVVESNKSCGFACLCVASGKMLSFWVMKYVSSVVALSCDLA